jgi:hypothetical protein
MHATSLRLKLIEWIDADRDDTHRKLLNSYDLPTVAAQDGMQELRKLVPF